MMSWVYSRIYHQQYYYLGVKKSLIHPKWRAFNNIIRRSWTIRNRGFWILLVKLHTTYHLVMTHSLPWKDPPFLRGKPSISMGHLYHGELLVITRRYLKSPPSEFEGPKKKNSDKFFDEHIPYQGPVFPSSVGSLEPTFADPFCGNCRSFCWRLD